MAVLLAMPGTSSLLWGDGDIRFFTGLPILIFATVSWLFGRTVKYILG